MYLAQKRLFYPIRNSGRVWAHLGPRWRELRAWLWWPVKGIDITNAHTKISFIRARFEFEPERSFCHRSAPRLQKVYFLLFGYKVGLIIPDRSDRFCDENTDPSECFRDRWSLCTLLVGSGEPFSDENNTSIYTDNSLNSPWLQYTLTF